MLSVFQLVLKVISLRECSTKLRRASHRARYIVMKHLSSMQERTLFINNPGKVLGFPKYPEVKGKK